MAIKTLMKKALGIACVAFEFGNLQYHLYFFIKYFVFNFSYKFFNSFFATLLNLTGIYLLLRCNLLLMLCVTTPGGSIKNVKKNRTNLDRWRKKVIDQQNFSEIDKATIRNLHSNYDAISGEP